jgi:hypothetical protein
MKSAELGAELEDAFLRAYPDMPEERARHLARNLTQVIAGVIDIGARVSGTVELTHMDTANALVYWCTTGGYLEEVAAGRLEGAVEPERLTRELSARVADLLICIEVLSGHPSTYEAFIRGSIALGTSGWERERGKLE